MTVSATDSTSRYWLCASDGGVAVPDGQRLGFDGPIIVGRSTQATIDGERQAVDLVLPGDRVSRTHARLAPDEQGVWVEDLRSRNGTYVNDRRVDCRTRLSGGDRISFGVAEFLFEDRGPPPPPPSPAEAPEAERPAAAVARKPVTRIGVRRAVLWGAAMTAAFSTAWLLSMLVFPV
jgi:hypothetical protein